MTRYLLKFILLYFILTCSRVDHCSSQDIAASQDNVLEVTPDMFVGDQQILLGTYDGWLFSSGADNPFLRSSAHELTWKKLKPSELGPAVADHGRVEGWFTIKVKLDKSFESIPLHIVFQGWGAVDAYLDGTHIGSSGNTGAEYEEINPYKKRILRLDIQPGGIHEITIHIVDFITTFPVERIRGGENSLKYYVYLAGPRLQERIAFSKFWDYFEVSWASVNGTTFFILFVVALFNRTERNLPLIAGNIGIFFLAALLNFPRFYPDLTFQQHNILEFLVALLLPFNLVMGIILVARIFNFKISLFVKLLLVVVFITGLLNAFLNLDAITTATSLVTLVLGGYILARSWSSLHGAQWAVVSGMMITTFTFVVYGFVVTQASASLLVDVMLVGIIFTATPLSLAFYVAIRFTEIVKQLRLRAEEVVRVSVEKEKILASQNELLEQQVKDRTDDLTKSIETLKSTQAQLIQSEKMASLGELTAGIAHEIQNPLNFVNNFSEVNTELIDDLKKELISGNSQSAAELSDTIKENEEKINHHGKRADAIVKNMLLHSRKGGGQKELTDINALCEEYLRLAYHGFRAKDKNNSPIGMKTELDSSVPKVMAIAQDIGRVLLNLFNNAFHAVTEKGNHSSNGGDFKVTVATKRLADKIEIRVKDNGSGISPVILEKIFQPFFTTKPAGQGTGLGLSLAYDIITKAHGGELKVESEEGKGSEFIILLPLMKNS